MTRRIPSPQPPRLAERLLRVVVGSTPDSLSIIGDAREEYEVRGLSSRLGPALWYWTYVLRFVGSFWIRGALFQVADVLRHGPGPGATGVTGEGWRAMRGLLRRPWMTTAVVTTLAVGLGATTLAFTLVDRVLLRPLPYPDAHELVDVSRVNPDWFGPNPSAAEAGNIFATPAATFFDWEVSANSFSSLGAYAWTINTFTDGDRPESIVGAVATSGLFETLGIPAALGRPLVPYDDEVGAAPVMVLSHRLWQRRYGGNPAIVGRTARIDGIAATVVGVMPEGFSFPTEETGYWVSFDDESKTDASRRAGYLHALGRLAPGLSLERARAEMGEIQERLGQIHSAEARFIAVAFSRHEMVVAASRGGLLLLLGAASIVLLVGCANVSNLLLTRATERRRELALHTALGASRGRLARLLLSESILLSLVGGLAGIALAVVGLEPVVSALSRSLPRVSEIRIDGRLIASGLGASLFVGLVLGILPAVRTGRTDLERVLRDGGNKTTGGRRSSRSHALLVVSEVALSVLLLCTSGIFVQSYLAEAGQKRGFNADNLATVRISVSPDMAATQEERRTFFEQLAGRVASLRAVSIVGMADQMPYSGCCSSPPASIRTRGGVEEASVHTSAVSPGYFAAMDIPLLAGRALSDDDRAGSTPVVVVSEAMAQRFWPGESPIGAQVRLETDADPAWHEVVGVVGSVRYQFGGPEYVEYYRAFAQAPSSAVTFVLRTEPSAGEIALLVSETVHALNPELPVNVRPVADLLSADDGYQSARMGTAVLLFLAAVATALAVLGMYTVLASAVVRRTREIGIRVSLGGTRTGILKDVLGSGIMMTAIGVGIGLVLSIGASAVLRSSLTGVAAVNPGVLIAVVVAMFVTAATASLVPAWRTTRIDPLVAFREE